MATDVARGRDKAKVDFEWQAPEVIWEHDGYRLVRLTNPDDLITLGRLMGHCAGWHQFWARTGMWGFLTFLDSDDVPHVTIHLKDAEWYTPGYGEGRKHPMDGVVDPDFKTFTGAYGNRKNVARHNMYDRPVAGLDDLVSLDGRRYRVILAQNRGDYGALPGGEKYNYLVMGWYNAFRVTD